MAGRKGDAFRPALDRWNSSEEMLCRQVCNPVFMGWSILPSALTIPQFVTRICASALGYVLSIAIVRSTPLLVRIRFIPALLSTLIITCVQAQVMECMDSQGRKEYSTTCPSGTVSQKEVRIKAAAQPGPADSPTSSYQEQESAFQQRRIQREADENAAVQRQRLQQIAERECADARRKMDQLQSGIRLRWTDKATREHVIMTEADHEKEMKRMESVLRQCRF